jgi:DNA-binding FrmR family transcriptional regulator
MAWDFRHDELPSVENVFVLGDYRGSIVPPGNYSAKLTLGEREQVVSFKVTADPRLEVTQSDFMEQYSLMIQIDEIVRDMHKGVNRMRKASKQVDSYMNMLEKMKEVDDLVQQGSLVQSSIKNWEEKLIQPKQKTFQDVINFRNQLNTEFLNLRSRVDQHDPRLTQGAKKRFEDLAMQWSTHKSELNRIINEEIAQFNGLFKEFDIPAIWLENK